MLCNLLQTKLGAVVRWRWYGGPPSGPVTEGFGAGNTPPVSPAQGSPGGNSYHLQIMEVVEVVEVAQDAGLEVQVEEVVVLVE